MHLKNQKFAYTAPRLSMMGRPRTMSVEGRFESKVDRSGGEDACHLWLGTTDKDGFGVFKLPKATDGEWWSPWQTSNVQAHLFSAQLSGVQFPNGHHLKHSCGNRGCCNVKHLVSCAPVDVSPSEVDTTNENPEFWESVLKKCGLSMHAGLSKGKLFHNGLQGRIERDRREDDTEEQSAFEELMQQAERSRRQLPETSPVPPAPPQDDDLPWRGMAYESRVRKLG